MWTSYLAFFFFYFLFSIRSKIYRRCLKNTIASSSVLVCFVYFAFLCKSNEFSQSIWYWQFKYLQIKTLNQVQNWERGKHFEDFQKLGQSECATVLLWSPPEPSLQFRLKIFFCCNLSSEEITSIINTQMHKQSECQVAHLERSSLIFFMVFVALNILYTN